MHPKTNGSCPANSQLGAGHETGGGPVDPVDDDRVRGTSGADRRNRVLPARAPAGGAARPAWLGGGAYSLAERRRRGTPAGSRALTCFWEAVLALHWFRDRTCPDALARDHGISQATAYRYLDEVIEVLASQAPDLRKALERAKDTGFSHVILDGKGARVRWGTETGPDRIGATAIPFLLSAGESPMRTTRLAHNAEEKRDQHRKDTRLIARQEGIDSEGWNIYKEP
jgi:hypothetical protein